MEWKGPREWAIERDSVRNKKKYAAKWGYDLEIVDMSTKKRYAHEWRESWEKVDTIRNCLRKYPKAEWHVSRLLSRILELTLDIQVLVAGSQYLHNGTFLLPPIPHLRSTLHQHLPRHQHLQPSEHFPPFHCNLSRCRITIAYRRQQIRIYTPCRPPRLWGLQPWLVLCKTEYMDRPCPRRMVGPCVLRTETYGMGAQRAGLARISVHESAVDKTTYGIHTSTEGQQFPSRCLRRRRRRSTDTLPGEGSRLLSQYGGM